jgi:hypothetical protein
VLTVLGFRHERLRGSSFFAGVGLGSCQPAAGRKCCVLPVVLIAIGLVVLIGL